jgi:hypothetical membrane protein
MTMHRSVFARGRWAVAIAVALTIGSMLRYPGGTALDPASRGYSLWRNFLSDLGMTVAWDRRPNALGAALFVASLGILVLGLGGCLVGVVRVYSTSNSARRFARAAAAVGLLVCAAFVGVAVTPENRVMSLHVGVTLFAFRAFPILSFLLLVATLRSGVFPRGVSIAWAALTAVLTAYVAVLGWGPSLTTDGGLRVQVVAQKIVVVVALSVFVYISVEADRVIGRSS